MAKRLVCIHPHASYEFGIVETVDDTTAATMLGIFAGRYRCWELLKDLGPDANPAPAAPAPVQQKEATLEAPNLGGNEPAEAPATQPEAEQASDSAEAPKGKKSSK